MSGPRWREPPPPFDQARIAPELLARAHGGWQRLYRDERDSLVASSHLLADLTRLGAPLELLAEGARVVEDETRHTRVCAHVVAALGPAPTDDPPEATREPLSGPLAERVAALSVVGFVVGESMSAASFAEARRRAGEPIARWAYTELLRDEARHGGFGARAGAFALARLDAGFAPLLWPRCVAEMEGMERRVGGPYDEERLAREGGIDDLETLEGLGLLRGSASCAAFYRAIERWVVPRLRALGVVVAA